MFLKGIGDNNKVQSVNLKVDEKEWEVFHDLTNIIVQGQKKKKKKRTGGKWKKMNVNKENNTPRGA